MIGRLCEGFACTLRRLSQSCSVVKDFGVGGWRTDRGANGLLGSKTLAWDVDGQLNRRLCRANEACFWLVSNSWTRQDMTGKQRQFGPSLLSHRHESTEGRKDVGELLMKNVFRKMLLKTCFRTCFFQSLGVTRHVPFMVWRDWPDWSDDSEVSTGGTRLDRRRELQYHVRSVCGCWTTGNKLGWTVRVRPRAGHRG